MNALTFIQLLILGLTLITCGPTTREAHERAKSIKDPPSFQYDAYTSSVLSDVAKDYDRIIDEDWAKVPSGKDFVLIEARPAPIKVKLVFCNEVRPLTKEHRQIVQGWLTSKGAATVYKDLFQKEIRVREDQIDYWLPIQDQLIPYLRKEIQTNEMAEFYITYFGAYNHDHVFVIHEFQKIR